MQFAVTSLLLTQFRSHTRTELRFDGSPVAIYGPNGAGKTNLIEAISLLSPGRGLRRAVIPDLMRRPEKIGWRIGAELESLGRTHEIEIRAEAGESGRTIRIDGKTAPQIALGRLTRVVWLVPSMDRLWIEGAEGRRRFLDRIALSFEPRHADVALDYEKAMRERNRLLRDQVDDPRWYDALETRMGDAGASIVANRAYALERLSDAQAGAHTQFPVADLSLQSDHPVSTEGLRDALAHSRRDDLRARRSLVGPHRADLTAVYAAKGVAASQCSTGEQKALLISLILANARALSADLGAAPIVLLDEVAAHLDADRRAALYDEICALGSQAFLTGTGPELFETLTGRAQELRVIDDDGRSQATLI